MTLLFLLLIMCLFIVGMFKIGNRDMTYVRSDLDNNFYLVRDLQDKQDSANVLAKLRQNIFSLTNYMNDHKNDKQFVEYLSYIEQLKDRIQNVIIVESSENSNYTSYSINKGEQLVFCIRSIKNKNNMHDVNLMMYVVLHEMSHVACPEIGHTQLFKKIFAFFTNTAISLNMYNKISFTTDHREYCGMNITDSIV